MSAAGRVRRLLTVVTAGVATLALSGCQGVYDLPLPGGAATGSDAYHVTVEFADVLDLVPQSAVKVNDVTVGAVDAVHLRGSDPEVLQKTLAKYDIAWTLLLKEQPANKLLATLPGWRQAYADDKTVIFVRE